MAMRQASVAAGAGRLQVIIETQRALADCESELPELIALACARARELTGADEATVLLLDDDGFGLWRADGDGSSLRTAEAFPLESFKGAVLLANEARLCEDTLVDDNVNQALAHRTGARSLAAAPLRHGGRAIGVLNASSLRPHAFTEVDLQTLELLAVGLSGAMLHASEREARRAELETSASFHAVLDGASIGIGRWDGEGRLLEANRVLADLLARSPAAAGEATFAELAGLDPEEGRRLLDELLRGERRVFKAERRLVDAAGRPTWTQLTAVSKPAEPGSSPQVVAMLENITERKQSELALRATTERLARIVETQADVAAAGSSLETALRIVAERLLTITNAVGAAIWLPEGDDLVCRVGVGVAEAITGRRRPRAGSVMEAALEARRAILIDDPRSDPRLDPAVCALTGERSHICTALVKDGHVLAALNLMSTSESEPLNEDDRSTVELVAVVVSAAISRTAESQALARFAAIYQGAPIGIGVVGLDGVFLDANGAMCEITGRTLDELAAGPVATHLLGEEADEAVARFAALVRGSEDGFRYESRYLRADGEVAWVDATATLLRDAEGRPELVLVMAQDVSARRKAEEQLRHSQKLEAIGQLTAGIAHDFNNALMGVLGYAGLARETVAADSVVARHLTKIETSGERAASLTRQLLAFGRRQTLQPRPLQLNELVLETLGMLDRVLGEQIEIVPTLGSALPPLLADPTQLQQVLVNLALNARDAMPNGGVLEIETSMVDLAVDAAPDLEIGCERCVVLTVRDNGTGMTDEVRARIFEPFFTTKSVGEGTGLGLASVHGIVKQSRGDITVESEVGVGTTFRIYLPAEAGDTSAV